MKLKFLNAALAGLILSATCLVNVATAGLIANGYTTVDLSSYVNNNIYFGSDTYPTNVSKGNQDLDIPFDIAEWQERAGAWIANGSDDTLSVDLSSFNITGQASFYALLNNYYGTPAVNEYEVTINTVSGMSITYQSIGDYDTRDYNDYIYTNGISGASTTTEWFNNNSGQRLDVRVFDLPTNFSNETLASFSIKQIHNKDWALLSGLTFSSAAPISFDVPEPSTLAIFALGIIGFASRRFKKQA